MERALLATSYKAEVFSDWLGDGSRPGLEVEYVTEDVPRCAGGVNRNVSDSCAAGRPDEPVLIFNGDVLSGHDIRAQLDLHAKHDADVTLYLTEVEDARAFGCVPLDEEGRVTALLEKMPKPVTTRINAGCYVFRRSVIDTIPNGKVISVERQTFPGLLAEGRVVTGYVDTAYWLDLGTPAAFVKGSRTSSPAGSSLPQSLGPRVSTSSSEARASTARPTFTAARLSVRGP